ncbi:hypothetical protein IM660_01775 [Ruania alkalisoli]|uniref:Gram-positive cocci surface proteins LPxTG domain-containing protein n=1 Tax=Ruania alkalisoli TaxID=2779775 RepID=A0A7M1SU00_9MICO|nr:hypothetical protein [Ruania alkalisoli]QOR71069.1 hypothetical protein IM660_01775 [Ruania alkalisoli]
MRHAFSRPGTARRRPAGVLLGGAMAAILAMTAGASAVWAETTGEEPAVVAEESAATTTESTEEQTQEAVQPQSVPAEEPPAPEPPAEEPEPIVEEEPAAPPPDEEPAEEPPAEEVPAEEPAEEPDSEPEPAVEEESGAAQAPEARGTEEATTEDAELQAIEVEEIEEIDPPSGNPTAECQAAGFDYGVKLDTGEGSYTYPTGPWEPSDLDVALSVTFTSGFSFSFTADPAVDGILVKASTDSHVLAGGSGGVRSIGGQHEISHVTFCYSEEEELTVTQEVETSFDRAHHWTLDKWADVTELTLYPHEEHGPTSGTVMWTIDVGYDGYTDLNHVVSGTIWIENTGDTTATFDGSHVLETSEGDYHPDLDCAPLTPTLDPGESVTCTYSQEVGSAVTGQSVVSIFTAEASYDPAPAAITWGDPDNEFGATMDLEDISDINGTLNETFTAPEGGMVTYDWTFNWSDFGTNECGEHTFDNTATLLQAKTSVTESVVVEIVCLETAPQSPALAQAICTDGHLVPPALTLADTPGITYTADPEAPYMSGQTVEVTASLAEGYVWGDVDDMWTVVDDLTAVTEVTFEEVACIPTLPEPPSIDDGDCLDGAGAPPTLSLVETAGVTYTVDPDGPYEPGQTVTVTATLADGYEWADPGESMMAPTAATSGGRALPARAPIGHAPMDHEGMPAGWPEGWTLVSATEATYEVTFADPECPQTQVPQVTAGPQLPSTGAGSLDLAALALVTLTGGLLLAVISRRRWARQG